MLPALLCQGSGGGFKEVNGSRDSKQRHFCEVVVVGFKRSRTGMLMQHV